MLTALCTERFSEKDGKIKQTDMPYVYPIQLDTEEGAKLDSRNTKIVVCKVAPELMNSMTTEAMPEKALVRIRFALPGFGEENLQIRILRQLHNGIPNEKNGRVDHSASFIGEFGETQERVLQYIFKVRRTQNRD